MITPRTLIAFFHISLIIFSFSGISGCSSTFEIREPELLELSGDLNVHDPVIIHKGDTYYVFCTGGGRGGIIPVRTSKDLRSWKLSGYALPNLPATTVAPLFVPL